MQKLLTVQEFHELARIAVSTIYHLAAEHKIPHVRIGARLLFNQADIEEWLKLNSVQVTGPTHTVKSQKKPRGQS